jgi:hypothetical protein
MPSTLSTHHSSALSNYDNDLGLCWDNIYKEKSLVWSNPERAKHLFDNKVYEKAET